MVPGLKQLGVGGRSGRHHPSDFTLDQLFGLAGIFHLVADGDPVAAANQLGDIAFSGVIRNAAHRHRHALLLVAGSERDLQFLGGHQSVFKEELIEISQAEQ